MSSSFRWPAKPSFNFPRPLTFCFLALLFLFVGVHSGHSAVTLVSSVPVNGANNVIPSAPVVFTFSTSMDPVATVPFFLDEYAGESPDMNLAWNSNTTVLTCTPSPQFANAHEISWSISGQSTNGTALTGPANGTFTNVAGVNGGSGTNLDTAFELIEYSDYGQTSAAPPSHLIYEFFAQTTLASNRTATNITVTFPTSVVTNLAEEGLTPEVFDLSIYKTALTNFTSNFPSGTYTFDINPASLNQQVAVTLPAYTFPNAPQVSNYVAAQSVNPAQPFTVTWNTFSNSTSADLIGFIIVDTNANQVFASGLPGQPGVLANTAASETIPAGTLQTNANYTGQLLFIHITLTTNGNLTSSAVVGTVTEFNLSTTTNTAGPTLTLRHSGTNVVLSWPTSATGYTLEATTSLSSPSWSTSLPSPVVVSTNYVVTNGISTPRQFYRLINP